MKTDIRESVTNRIIELIEAGGLKKIKRWSNALAGSAGPVNPTTGAEYKGANTLLLWAESMLKDYKAQKWMTYKQAEALGAQVRKGERSVMGAFWSKVKKKDETVKEGDDKTYMLCRPFFLFNVAQIDGLDDAMYQPNQAPEGYQHNPIEAAEKMIEASGAVIKHGGTKAYYSSASDYIVMPPRSAFPEIESYYAVVQHELTHWTGHESRLNRQFGKRFGDQAYAFEELVAELGSAFTAAHVGIVDDTVDQHATYIDSWINVLKRDKTAIFTAAKHANAAADYLIGLTKQN